MNGIYCKTKLTQLLIKDQRLDFIPKDLFGIIVSYAADERFVRPFYVGQSIIVRDLSNHWSVGRHACAYIWNWIREGFAF